MNNNMTPLIFFTTFSKNGYYVYGKTWIESFLKQTKNCPHITAKIYVDGMDVSQIGSTNKVTIVDFDQEIPAWKPWKEMFLEKSAHGEWNKQLAVKFSFKSFVMMDMLEKTKEGHVIWLDADCEFLSTDFNNFPQSLLENTAIACQREAGSEHVESGVVIFDAAHPDKDIFLNKIAEFYNNSQEFNSFGQFFDGFAIHRALDITQIRFVDLNQNFGHQGIQSDPGNTFLNPEISKRFIHNIGITGKRKYKDFKTYSVEDEFFKLIHGWDEPTLEEKVATINDKIALILRSRLK